ncbi:MAG: KH domain-containing protein [Chloroflexi bacterium]|nr:KH domain-containing protein [Chloroflexota bacterium]
MAEGQVKELIEYIAKALVDHPEQVRVEEVAGARSVIYELHVAPSDMGRVIGKNGRVANAMRSLIRVASTQSGKRAILEIVE